MADGFVTIDLAPSLSFQQRTPTADIQARLLNMRPGIAVLPAVMRHGEGSIEDQQLRGMTMGRNGRSAHWPQPKTFGTSKPGPSHLVRRGKYLAGWLGGTGGFTTVSDNSASIGVSTAAFPQVRVFQRDSPTQIKVTPKMRVYLGLNKGVWLKKSTTHLTIAPRAFSVNPVMTRRARQVLLNYVINGKAAEYQPGSFAA